MDLVEKYLTDEEALREYTKEKFDVVAVNGFIEPCYIIKFANDFCDENKLTNIDIDALEQFKKEDTSGAKDDSDLNFEEFVCEMKFAFKTIQYVNDN